MGMSSKIATASMRLVAERVQRCMHVMEGGGEQQPSCLVAINKLWKFHRYTGYTLCDSLVACC